MPALAAWKEALATRNPPDSLRGSIQQALAETFPREREDQQQEDLTI